MPVFVQQYTAARGLEVDRLANGDLSFVAHDGGAMVNLTLTQAQAEPFANFILDAPEPPPPPPPSGDNPPWGNVVLQSDFECPDGSTTPFLDDTGRHTIGGMTAGWSQIKTDQAITGTSSHWSANTFSLTVANSPDFDLSAANNDEVTIDYKLRQTDTASNYNVLSNASGTGGGACGWSLRHYGASLQFAWFDDTGAHHDLTAPNVGWVANAIQDVRFSKNSAGKMRLFLNGHMVASATPANSTIRVSNQPLTINKSGPGQQSRIDRLRIVKGVCLHDSDDDYVPGTVPFPIG